MSLQLIENGLNNSELLKTQLGSRHNKYVISVLNEIKKTANDDKKSLVNCTPDSIISAIKQACDLQLEIDGRQHCHLVKYNKNTGTKESPKWISEAQLQVGYRGFIYSIKRAYPDANIDCKLVYEGDSFVVKSEGDTTTYSLEIKDPFAKKEKIIGGYCHISYTLGGRLVSFCETMSLAEINKIKGKAKQDSIWQEWFEEKAKVAIIRRACKIHFSGIQQIEQITEFDNQDYDLEKDVVSDCINSEQGIEIEKLAKSKGVALEKICEAYEVKTIIDLPSDKFQLVIKRLKATPDPVKVVSEVSDANN
jgi:phage RecT family recombinase